MKRRIPYGVGNFEKIVDGNYFFVDKTAYIHKLEQYETPVFLRPRRFGKSLWCSLLECYYDVNRADRFNELFSHLDIGKDPTPSHNMFMVMRFNFSVIEVKPDIQFINDRFAGACRIVYEKFLKQYENYFTGIDIELQGNAAEDLKIILSKVDEHNLPQVYVIIDEYDNFTNQLITSHNDKLYKDLTGEGGDSFFKTFFKVIKAGVEEGSISKTYLTGVLPITIDDMTSGFNIAEIITLRPSTINMLGFTQSEVERYVADVFKEYELDPERMSEIESILKNYYNGYMFSLESQETLYNSTILNHFLKSMVLDDGRIPREFIDSNLRVDINWLRRLSTHENDTRDLLNTLMLDNELQFDVDQLSSKFNMSQFFEKEYYAMSLFYLGMLTVKDRFTVGFPNQSMFKIFTEYYNDTAHIEVSKGYTEYFRQYLKDLDIEQLFCGYWDTYVGQIPAQAFDKMNENFFRTSFYELCTRYLSYDFTFAIEANRPSGRSDMEILGKFHTEYADIHQLIEFKYFTKEKAKTFGVWELSEPDQKDIDQINGYEADVNKEFPTHKTSKHIIYIVSNDGFRYFKVQ